MKLKKPLAFAPVLLIPLILAYSIQADTWHSYTGLLVLFGLIPFLELWIKADPSNFSKAQETQALKNPMYDVILYLLALAQIGLIVFFLFELSGPREHWAITVGKISAMGLSCGIFGINVAHELGHRKSRIAQFTAKVLLMSSLYMHFFIEHNRGHHKKVGTPEDPSSARKGESIYAFFLRSIRDSWRSARKLEGDRLRRLGHSEWHYTNEFLQFQLIQIALVTGIFMVFGSFVVFCFLLAAFLGILLLESVNYIEHYGLQRQHNGKVYELPGPVHSWNSNHLLGRIILLQLSRHSDHHYNSSRTYPILRHFDESPQMPTGYPGMILLALIPPLWFRQLNKRVDRMNDRSSGKQY